MVDVSVIVVNYNTRTFTENCIRLVIERTKNVTYEIIIVDNNSTLFNPQIFVEQFPSVRLIKNSCNAGFAAGNNAGILHAEGNYMLLLNSDTELVNDAISIAFSKMESDKTIGALTGKLIYPDGRIQGAICSFPSLKNQFIELFRLGTFEKKAAKAVRLKGDLWDYANATDGDWIWGTFFMFKKDLLQIFPEKKLHEDFFMYYEDVLWCYHIKKNAHLRIHYFPEPVIIHHLSGSSINTSAEEIFAQKILPNEYAFITKTKGKPYAFLYYIIKALHQFTLRKKMNIQRGMFYLKFIKTKIVRN